MNTDEQAIEAAGKAIHDVPPYTVAKQAVDAYFASLRERGKLRDSYLVCFDQEDRWQASTRDLPKGKANSVIIRLDPLPKGDAI